MHRFLALLLTLLLSGCGVVTTSYVEADAATYEAVAPEYLEGVERSDVLDEKQKERRRETIRSWKARIDRERGIKEGPK